MATTDCDYIVIGSGAGGGPLAANLARAGYSVLLLEAGGDPCSENETGRLMYEVPIFHGLATEFGECQWDYYVHHYSNPDLEKKDKKYVTARGGVCYPRAGALGGCTAHNAMITVVPPDEDWNELAALLGDESWKAERMTQYYDRLENAYYVPRPGSLRYYLHGLAGMAANVTRRDPRLFGFNQGHGFSGWLGTSEPDPGLALRDPQVVEILIRTVAEALKQDVGDPFVRTLNKFDPNDVRSLIDSPDGVASTPLAVLNGKRNGPREFMLKVQKDAAARLTIQKHALASSILFDGTRAIGVEYLEGAHLYRA